MKKYIFILLLISISAIGSEVRRLPLTPVNSTDPVDDPWGLFYHRAHGGGGHPLSGGEGFIVPITTPGDANGEGVDSIRFHIYECDTQIDYVWGLYTSDFSTLVAEQTDDATITVNDTGWHSVTNWTNNTTLSNYTQYWLLIYYSAVADIRFHAGDMPEPLSPKYHQVFDFGSLAFDTAAYSKYDGEPPTTAEMASTHFGSTGTGHEIAPVFLYYTASSPQDTMALVTEFHDVSTASFYLLASWNLPADSVILNGTQKQPWICETPSISLSVDLIDVTKRFTVSGDSVLVDGTHSPEWFTDGGGIGEDASWSGDMKPGLPYFHIAQAYYNDERYYHDTMSCIRIPNIWTNNTFYTDTIAASCSLFVDLGSTGAFNPTQRDSIIIASGDTLHIFSRGYTPTHASYTQVSWPEIPIDKGLFKGEYDTTFAHITIESGAVLQSHGDTRINILSLTNNGTISYGLTDSIFVGDAPFTADENILGIKYIKIMK